MVPVSIALLPGVSTPLWGEAMTLAVRGRGVQAPLERMSSMIYPGQPPCDQKTLEAHLDQRRAIGRGICSREVKCALPQWASVLELVCTCKPLFLKKTEASTEFSCNV